MKKIFLSVTALVISVAGFSQLSFGLHGTGTLADAQVKNENDFNYKRKMRAMPGAGIDVQYTFSKHFAVRTGVNYVQNGVTLKTTVDETVNMQLKIENNLNYIQVPVNVLYTIPVSRMQFYAGGGGFVNYGVSGKSKARLSYTMPDGHEAVIVEEADAFKKEEEGGMGLKKTDFGASVLAGLRLGNGLFIHIGYQLSLADIDQSGDDAKYKNRNAQFTIGYFFK
ncbi:MAG: PorT family protein [Chitinophagaceae bacterium]|nr:PorT family protein [Chitinophagaceae bacterium]